MYAPNYVYCKARPLCRQPQHDLVSKRRTPVVFQLLFAVAKHAEAYHIESSLVVMAHSTLPPPFNRPSTPSSAPKLSIIVETSE